MQQQPTLETERLLLRPLTPQDAPTLQRLAGRREIADTTISIPHPYSEEQARQWITGTDELYAKGKGVVFAMILKREGKLAGTIGLKDIDVEHSQAELGFWVAVECWGQGYATEAARAVVAFGFRQLGLNRIYAHHMVRNPASGWVLAKIGMKREGLLRQRVRKWEVFEDVVPMALLREEWSKTRSLVPIHQIKPEPRTSNTHHPLSSLQHAAPVHFLDIPPGPQLNKPNRSRE